MAFVHQAQRPADLHEQIGIFRRGKRGMREQTWSITLAPGYHHPSAPERGANLPTTCCWALRRHVDASHAYARCAQVCNPRTPRSYAGDRTLGIHRAWVGPRVVNQMSASIRRPLAQSSRTSMSQPYLYSFRFTRRGQVKASKDLAIGSHSLVLLKRNLAVRRSTLSPRVDPSGR